MQSITGTYVPRHLRQQHEEQQKQKKKGGATGQQQEEEEDINKSPALQRRKWAQLEHSLIGLVNRASRSNMEQTAIRLFRLNLVRGRGLLCNAIIRAVIANEGMSVIFASLVAVVNKEIPDVGNLLIRRLVIRWKSYNNRREKQSVKMVSTFLAHLVMHRVQSPLLLLKLLASYLCKGESLPSRDDIELATHLFEVSFKFLQSSCPAAFHALMEPIRELARSSGELDQISVSNLQRCLGAVQKWQLVKKDEPVIPADLDLVPEEEQITHEIELEGTDFTGEKQLDNFAFDPEYTANEERYAQRRTAILGDDAEPSSSDGGDNDDVGDSDDEHGGGGDGAQGTAAATGQQKQQQEPGADFSDEQNRKLRQEIFLLSKNSIRSEEFAHKLLKNVPAGSERVVAQMVLECCAHEKLYSEFYAFLTETLCHVNAGFKRHFADLFDETVQRVDEFPTDKIVKFARIFAYMLRKGALRWSVWSGVVLSEAPDAASSRIFIKEIFTTLAQDMSAAKLQQVIREPEVARSLRGIFPRSSLAEARFSINFFNQIKLGQLTEDLLTWYNREVQSAGSAVAAASSSSTTTATATGHGSDAVKKRSRT